MTLHNEFLIVSNMTRKNNEILYIYDIIFYLLIL